MSSEEYQSEISDSGEEMTECNFNSQNSAKRKNLVVPDSERKKKKYEDINDTKKSKKYKNDIYKQPTVEELNELNETKNLYNNNLFRLQISELISEIKIKNKRKKYFSEWFNNFKSLFDKIPEHDSIFLSEIEHFKKIKQLTHKEKLIKYLKSNSVGLKTDHDIVLKFLKPDAIGTFGLYKLNSLPGPELIANIIVSMPKSFFNIKDYLNNRYFVKKHYYLLYIAKFLSGSNLCDSVSFDSCESNILLPILKVIPKNSSKTQVCIYLTPSDEYFKPSRFLPEQNNMKLNLFDDLKVDEDILKNTGTVMYNSVILHDVTLTTNHNFFETLLQEQTSLQEGLKLLLVWMNQRQFNIYLGSINETLIIWFVVYLIVKRRINKHMSSYQVIRNFWSFISNTDFTNVALSICDVPNETLTSFKKQFDIVLLDKTGCYNVAANVDVDVLKKFKQECDVALTYLDDKRVGSFHSLFITKIPSYLQYDVLLNVPKIENITNIPSYSVDDSEKAKFIGCHKFMVVNYIKKQLKQAFNKRVSIVVPKVSVGKNQELRSLQFGINLDPEHAFHFIELGPALNDHKAASDFREFWSHLSSDRRFRDGTTSVAVVFKTNTARSKREIIKKIIDFILNEKLGLQYKLHYNEFEEFLRNKTTIASFPTGTNEEATLKVMTSSDDLGKKIRNLDMSLSITGVQGISDVYSYCQVFSPIPTNYKVGLTLTAVRGNNMIFSGKKIRFIPRYIEPLRSVLQLEHSSKWPNDLDAVRHLKTSFYLEISKQLANKFDLKTNVNPEHLDVLYEGFVFRYHLYVPKEISLLKKETSVNRVVCYKDSKETVDLELTLNVLPKVNGALRGIQSQHPSFGPGTALIKRWLRSQLIDDYYFSDVVINLLNSSLYINNNAYYLPNTPQMSFLRFLKFISELQWNLQTVVVNFNDELTSETIDEIESRIQQNREAFQPLYIIMPYDKGESLFTKSAPSVEVLYRIQELAIGTLKFIENVIENPIPLKLNDIFVPNWDGYNLLIHLRPLINPRRHEQIITEDSVQKVYFEPFDPKECTSIPLTDFDPVQIYLKELRGSYGEYANFFHDTYGGNTIGVLWDPKVMEPKTFKVSNVCARKLSGDNQLVFNFDAVIEDFYILGKDLVKSIERR